MPRNTCAPAVIKTRHSPLAKLRRWWRLRPFRAELAGLIADHAAVFQECLTIQTAGFSGDEAGAQALAAAMLHLRQIELHDITRRTAALRARIAAIEAAA